MLSPDFRDMLSALSAEGAEYLLVGGYALAAHGLPRATKDLDLWVRPTGENPARVYRALAAFGAPLDQITIEDLGASETVFQVGVPPQRIDLLTAISGVEFPEAWADRQTLRLGDVNVAVLSVGHLIINKRASGRPQDLLDVRALEALRPR